MTLGNVSKILLHIFAWIIFVGLCIEASAFIISTLATLFMNPEAASRFYRIVDLSPVYTSDETSFVTLTTLMIIVAVLKAILFFLIIKILYNKQFSLSHPFNEQVRRFVLSSAFLALGIGFFASWAAGFRESLIARNITVPPLDALRVGGADVWVFMGVILLVIAQVFKKGIVIQQENDLTV